MSKSWMVAVSVLCGVCAGSLAIAQDNGGSLVSPQDFQNSAPVDSGLRGPVDQGGALSGQPIDANPPHAFTPAPYDRQQGGFQPANNAAPNGYSPNNPSPNNYANNGPGSLDQQSGKKQKHLKQSSSGPIGGSDPGGAVGLTDRAAKSGIDVGGGAAKAGVGLGGKAAKEVFKAIF